MSYPRTFTNLVGACLVGAAAFMSITVPPEAAGGDIHRCAESRIGATERRPIETRATPDQTESAGPTELLVFGGTAEQREIAAWALQRFADAGLGVPVVDVHLHQDLAECKGNRGIYNSGLQRIDVCVNERNVVLHEIAHAWNHENLSAAQRFEYVKVGGFGSWDDTDTPWSERGSEDAADTIAWALLDEPITMSSPDGPIAQRDTAYLLLTGSHAPRISA
jgi:hypothetical protein